MTTQQLMRQGEIDALMDADFDAPRRKEVKVADIQERMCESCLEPIVGKSYRMLEVDWEGHNHLCWNCYKMLLDSYNN